MQKLLLHQQATPPPIEAFRKDVSPGLCAVLKRMMAKKAEDRFQTPAALAVALGGSARRIKHRRAGPENSSARGCRPSRPRSTTTPPCPPPSTATASRPRPCQPSPAAIEQLPTVSSVDLSVARARIDESRTGDSWGLSCVRSLAITVLSVTGPLAAQPLPGTQPLTAKGDSATAMVAGIDRDLDKKLAAAVKQRPQLWQTGYLLGGRV